MATIPQTLTTFQPKRRGIPRQDDPLHYEVPPDFEPSTWIGDKRIAAPCMIRLEDGRHIPQWANTVSSTVSGFHPAKDCEGYFMSYKFQSNNNCYNYACNIATNTFAQPGRMKVMDTTFIKQGALVPSPGPAIIEGAHADGLELLGDNTTSLAEAIRKSTKYRCGHLAALLIAEPNPKIGWNGDYHWVRSDSPDGGRWSQKDGHDQVTNFDFAGNEIKDPSHANWTVNTGPSNPNPPDPKAPTQTIVTYLFYAWMFVPCDQVEII